MMRHEMFSAQPHSDIRLLLWSESSNHWLYDLPPPRFVLDYKLLPFVWFMFIKESTVSKRSASTFGCVFKAHLAKL